MTSSNVFSEGAEDCEDPQCADDVAPNRCGAPLHERIADWARRTPLALAVCDDGTSLTYAELDAEAARIAGQLLARGAGPGDFVAVCLPRTPQSIAALLAVLKCGAAYVPLDPAYPAARIAMIVEDAAPVCVLTERALRDRVPIGAPLLELDAQPSPPIGAAPIAPVASDPQDAVYAIFTSGSTGRPKGVVVEQANLLNMVDWKIDAYRLSPRDRLSHLAGQGFDASVFEIWPALAAGASLHLVPDEARLSAEALQQWLLDRRITIAFAPTLLAEALAERPWPDDTSLRALNIGGEAMRRHPARSLPFACHNLYGPTECTVATSAYVLPRAGGVEGAPPIGRPIANVQIHLLDEHLHPVPPGSPGELCIAGRGVARGYLGRAELSAERFVPNPFGAGRLYRSGDLARWRSDGELEFLGRNDQQVKLRGYRIELGEIEAVLLGHADVAEAVVCLRRFGGEDRLAAYLVSAAAAPQAAVLRAYLDERLPAYMVPSAFVMLDRLPLNAHGKRDLAALPDPLDAQLAEQPWEAPEGEAEQRLAEHWQALLKVKRVGRRDDFFALGGHSLLAMQLCVRIREAEGVELPVRAVFEARTLAALAERVAQAAPVQCTTIARADRSQPIALSPVQRGLWFLEQLHPGSAFYNVPIALEIDGALDVTALRAGLDDLLVRHEALRTRFFDNRQGAVQAVQPDAALDFAEEDLRGYERDERGAVAAERIAAQAAEPFRLGQAPLLRVRLYRLNETRHRLLLVFHHLVVDGASFAVLGCELGERYAARRAGAASVSDRAEAALDYLDFAHWAASREREAERATQLAYWARQLAGVPALELPLDRPRSDRPRRIGAVEPLALDRRMAEGIDALARQHATTPFVVLLTALQILLHRHSGQTDFAVGTPAANRTRGEFDATVGVFINTLTLRADLSGEPDVAECLRRTQATLLDALAHQDLPFDDVVKAAAAPREPGRHPLFQAMLVLQPAPSTQLQLPDLVVRDAFVHAGTSRFDLLLTFSRYEHGLDGVLEYDADLFEAATMRALAAQLPCLLEAMLADPGCAVAQLECLPAWQRHQLLEEWNGAARDYDLELTLADRLALQAARTPQACAVTFEGRSLSYAELDRRAAALAARLLVLGVAPGVFVGVCMERSLELVIALVGILKAGGAYVPLDPGYPADRLAFMAEDAAFPVLLTQPSLPSALPAFAGRIEIVSADEAVTAVAPPPSCTARADDPAYMIYTSGSTGRPKGAIITHRGICNRLLWMQEAFGLSAADRVLQKTPCGFDVSVWEFFWPLMTGATLVVARPGGHRDSRYLAGIIRDERISTLHFVPSMLQAFLQEENLGGLDALRRVIVSGEALPPALVQRFQQRLPAELHNLYGPTEASVDVSWWPCPTGWSGAIVPIGRPVANTQLYVMDAAGRLLPPGVPGELCIGGVQVAAGYHNRAELSAEKFVADPFRGGGARLYRTGDRVRHAPDGALLFLGRLDHQVKIRGQRIELGEIEAQLTAHADVHEACVLALGDGGDLRLVAYVVPVAGAAAPTADTLTRFLAARLPAPMLPSRFVAVAAMPLSPNGKLDRKALPAPDAPIASDGAAHVAPRTPQEEIMALVWCEVLRLPEVSIDASFFDLGGDSIRVLEVRNLAEARGLPFALELIFRHPTIRGLVAAAMADGAASVSAPPPQPFEQIDAQTLARLPAGLEDAFPATLLQSGMLFHSEMERGLPIYHDVFRYVVAGAFDAARFESALAALTQRHAALRSAFAVTAAGDYVQIVHAAGRVPLTIEDLSERAAQAVAEAARAWIETEKHTPFDIARGPLLRVHVQILSDASFALGLGFHHVILDGWSVASFVAELLRTFAAPLDEAAPVGGVSLYARLEGEAQESVESRAFWQQQLDGWRGPARSLAVPEGRMGEAACVDVAISADTLERLRTVSREAAVPLKSALLAVHLVLMKSLGGSDDVVTGLVSSGRPEVAGGERVLGLFLNVLPLRCAPGARCWTEFLRDVFARERETFAHRRYPLARIQQDRGGGAFVETVFNFVHFHVFDQRAEMKPVAFEGFEMTNFPLAANAYIDPITQTLHLRLIYQTQAFEAQAIERLAARYRQVLESLAHAPQAAIAQTDLLLDADRDDLRAWNRTQVLRGARAPLHARIADWARRTPQALAVCDGRTSLTYAGLDAEAAQIARRLLALGAGPGRFVAVCLPRTPQSIAALLAVLKCGAAYVPLDPAYPPARIAMIVEDAAPVCVLAERALRDRLPADCATLCLDEHADAGEDLPLPAWPNAPDDAVYAIFTSGSTGRPKGVVVERAGLDNLVDWYLDYYAVTPAERISHLAGQGFDASVYEIWPALAGGASLHLPPDEARLSAEALQRWLLDRGVTNAFAPTLLGEALAELEWPRDAALRILSTAGEALRRHPSRALPFAYHNVYGPTECTVVAATHELPRAGGVEGAPPIGRPIANVQIHLLDEHLHPVPPGSPGELCIAGRGVARGYLGRAELSAERFVPNPFGAGRLYRSGDLARWRSDGELEFLGRNDQQVKLRGYRIELGEIEAVLLGHADVAEAVVCLRRFGGEDRLAAYLVPAAAAPQAAVLRAYLDERLPAYMVPSAFVMLDRLPLNAHGKRDLAALPDPLDAQLAEQPWEAPETEAERRLAEHWKALLKVKRVGRCDDFFALGGHSLLAMQLCVRIREAEGVELPVRAVFEARTLAALAERLKQAAPVQRTTIARADRSQPMPLSPVQRGLWFLDRLEGAGARTYLVPEAFRIVGALDVAALERALHELVVRHEVLRTVFRVERGEAVQVVLDADTSRLACIDLGGRPPAERERAMEQHMQADAETGFDLLSAPAFRTTLLRLAGQEHVLLFNLHHILCDGWSMGMLHRELQALYAAHVQGGAAVLPPLPVQYADYSAWMQQRLTSALRDRQLDYWRGRLAGYAGVLDLPLDFARPPQPSFEGSTFAFAVPAALADRLKAQCAAQGATLFIGALAAFAVFLGRLGGQDDVVVGTPTANRPERDIEGLIGFFVNTLAMRMDLGGEPGFAELIERVRQTALEAYEHADVPFASVVEAFGSAASSAQGSLIQAMLIVQNPADAELHLPDLAVTPLRPASTVAKFDLTLSLQEGADGSLYAEFEYATRLFAARSIEQMAARFLGVLEGLLGDPQAPVQAAPFLSASERERVTRAFNATATAYPMASVHDVFRAQARATPEAVALVCGDDVLSYAELDRRSDAMAARLRGLGVASEARVGVFAERSAQTIVALLGVLKAGGAYQPIDAATPPARVAHLLDDAQAKVLLTQRALLGALPPFDGAVRCIDDDGADWTDPALPEGAPVGARDLAYVMHTSGSTGEPKGVMIEHRSVVRLVKGADYVDFGGEQTFLSLATLAFDASTFEIWGALLNGHALMVAPPQRLSADEIAELLTRHRVTTLWLTAGLFHVMIDHRLDALAGLRQLIAGGDVLSPAHVRRFRAAHPQVRLVNGYGPTENTTFTCCYEVPADFAGASIPIGRPIANTRAYVLDRRGAPVPVGVRGELYVGGDGLARGYLGRAELTAERFVPDPFDTDPQARLYRTGDEARWLADGTLEFLGRRDQQVKLRGYRIELGEIEAALAGHAAVRDAAVLAREDVPGDRRLVAYVVPKDGDVPAETLRAFLREQLPDYMMPGVFVMLATLPLTPNGKVDRRALPAPQRDDARAFVAPCGREEIALAEAWREALQCGPVGADDHFFELGGHSLAAVKAMALASDALGMPIPVSLIFRHPLLKELAAQLRNGTSSAAGASIVPLRSRGAQPPVFCFHALFATALFYADLVRELGEDQPAYGLQTPGLYGEEAPQRDLDGLVERHLAAIRRVQPHGPYRLIGYCMGGVLALETARRLQAQGETVERLILIDSFHAPRGLPAPPTEPDALLKAFAMDLVERGGGVPHEVEADFSASDESGRIAFTMEWARRAHVLPPDIATAEMFVPWMRASAANAALYLGHAVAPYAGCVLFLRAEERGMDPLQSWGDTFGTALRIVDVPGNHASMIEPPHVSVLAAVIRAALTAAASVSVQAAHLRAAVARR
jgi:amino acid adenylation domain-containing protein